MPSPAVQALFISIFHPGLVTEWQFHDGHGYAFIDQSTTWSNAVDTCDAIGLDLVTPTSFPELYFLVEAAFNGEDGVGALNSWFWIGASNPYVDSSVGPLRAARGWYWARWTWDNGEAWGFQDFDGQMESGDWGYDTFGAAIVMTDIDTALSTRWDAYWRIAPASHSYKVVCETR